MVEVDPESLQRSQFGSITGIIFLDAGECQFPEKQWNDFPVVLAGWWLEQMLSLWRSPRGTAVCHFMDGPYFFNITAVDYHLWELKGVRDGLDSQEVQCLAFADPAILFRNTTIRAGELLDACRCRGWESSDIDHLTHYVQRAGEALDSAV